MPLFAASCVCLVLFCQSAADVLISAFGSDTIATVDRSWTQPSRGSTYRVAWHADVNGRVLSGSDSVGYYAYNRIHSELSRGINPTLRLKLLDDGGWLHLVTEGRSAWESTALDAWLLLPCVVFVLIIMKARMYVSRSM